MLPHLADRPLALVRCPDDTHHECFFQKNLMRGAGPGLHGGKAKNPKGGTTPFVFVDDRTGLESLAQMGVIEIHPWGTHRDHVSRPDLLVFDLDPDDSVPWAKVAEAAGRLRKILERLGLKSFLKISGNKGLHLHVPIEPTTTWEAAKNFANAVALALVEEDPTLYLANMSKTKRKGKIFIDFFRNGYGATSVAPYSVRAKNGGAVALPIEWKDAKKVDPRGFRIADVRKRLARRVPGGRGDPWKDYFKTVQRIPDLGSSRK
jgi:bifunctional non-homologous end joining protein LigD